MSSIAPSQLTLSFEPSLPERFPTLRAYVAHRTPLLAKSAKVIAADMDMSPSTLSRKLNPSEGDTQRFNLDDLEAFLESTGDAPAVIEYLAAKYMDSPDARKARALNKVERLAEELSAAMALLKGAA
ncbi:phage regulatory CII family protein [Acidovorax sp. 22279]|uniref:phage regulatory CII family protein n=1 Tax=Acidovorax sp. 22279 TaxID=3453900 RepID=UPI003F8735C3